MLVKINDLVHLKNNKKMTEIITEQQENLICDLTRGAIRAMGMSKDSAHMLTRNEESLMEKIKETFQNYEKELKRFELFLDLGIIVAPENYVHSAAIAKFCRGLRKSTYFNDAITDENFSHPSYIIQPGDKFHVRAFRQTVPRTTSTKERMDFIMSENPTYLGVQGAALVWNQKRDRLTKGYLYSSFDEIENLWQEADGKHGIPRVDAYLDGEYEFHLGYYEIDQYDMNAFLCFNKIS